MSAFYGGRAEVGIRCKLVQVMYTDFRSMYPTVGILQGLWQFVVAESLELEDATSFVQALLANITIETLHNPEVWKQLNVLVQVRPQHDILPVRTAYSVYSPELSTGVNRFSSPKPMWVSLADCIASTLLAGKPPVVISAMRFVPKGIQNGLKPISLYGNPKKIVNPATDNFYKCLNDLRDELRREKQRSRSSKRNRLEMEEFGLKTCLNATSYGIFLELNTTEFDRNQEVTCYGNDFPFLTKVKTIEEPGRYFHPIIPMLITGAARLMLAIAETLAKAENLTRAFCDTDSMAFAKPETMPEAEFFGRVLKIQRWFDSLNPYEFQEPLLKIEDENYEVGERGKTFATPYWWAVSAKRYALFNILASGEPLIRKATEHGLGNLFVPEQPNSELTDSEKLHWPKRFWHLIIKAVLGGHHAQIDPEDLSFLSGPAVSRYTTSKPSILNWLKPNQGLKYDKQIKPFTPFFIPRCKSDWAAVEPDSSAPVAPFDTNIEKALSKAYDRKTGQPVSREDLKSIQEALARFPLHPENKFLNGDFTDTGVTERRHVVATAIEHIGKESNRLEEQTHIGFIEDAQIHYGYAPSDLKAVLDHIKAAAKKYGVKRLTDSAKKSGRAKISVPHLRRILNDRYPLTSSLAARLEATIKKLDAGIG